MKVVVLKLDYHDDKAKKKIMKTASGHSGVVSIALDSKEMKLTVTGDIDPVSLATKLRKLCNVEIVSVGAPKAPEKKKEEPPKKEDPKKDDLVKLMQAHYEAYQKNFQYPAVPPYYFYNYSKPAEEDPNGCVIS